MAQLSQKNLNELKTKISELAKCVDSKSFSQKSKAEVQQKMTDCFELILEYGGMTNVRDADFQEAALALISAAEKGTGVYIDESVKKSVRRSDQLFPIFYELLNTPEELKPMYLTSIIPFLESSGKDSSFTLSVGPGDDPTQFFPHDDEFQRRVLETYSKNVVLVFEGGSEAGFADVYSDIFKLQGDALRRNCWMAQLLQDMSDLFHVRPNDISVQSPNDKVRILECTYKIQGKDHHFMLVLFHNNFLAGVNKPYIEHITKLTSANFLLCGIRHGACTNIFFQDSEIYLPTFQSFIFTHGSGFKSKELKTRSSSFRLNLQRLRNRYGNSGELYTNLTTTPEGGETRGFEGSILCDRNSRMPANDPYCVQGKENSALFWSGLGGKKRRQTKRRNQRTRKSKSRRNQKK